MACESCAATVILPFNKVCKQQTGGSHGSVHLPAVAPEAEPLYRRAADGFEAQLGPNHQNTLNCLGNFAGLLQKQGELDEAGHSSLGRQMVYMIIYNYYIQFIFGQV